MASNRRIPPGELSAYERWELPNIGVSENSVGRAKSQKVEEKIKPLTADDIEKIRQQAYDAGFEEGRQAGEIKGYDEGLISGKEKGVEDGVQQGLAEGQAKIELQLSELGQLVASLADPLASQQAILEQAVINVSMAISRAVIHRELGIDSSSIKGAVAYILSTMPKLESGSTFIVNSRDKTIVQSLIEELESTMELKVDDAISPGGCLIETSTQLIDYTVEKRFQKTVYTTLFSASKSSGGSVPVETSSSIDEMSDFPKGTLDEAQSELESLSPDIDEAPVSDPDSEASDESS